jgi:hypothetical protein
VPVRRPALVLLTVTVLALSACSGDPGPAADSPTSTATALVVGGQVDPAAAAALVTEARSLEAAELQQRAAEASGELEQELYAVSGLTDELGGEVAAAASIAETGEWMAGLAAEAAAYDGGPAARVAPFGVARRSGEGGSTFGMGFFGALVIGSVLGDAASSVVRNGSGRSGTMPERNGLVVTSTGTEATVTSTSSFTDKTGVRTEITSKTLMSGCPTGEGEFRASTRVEFSSTSGGGRTGKRGSMDVEVIGTVGDAAQLLGYDVVYQGEMADFRDSRGGYAQVTGTIPRDGGGTLAVTRTGGAYTDAIGTSATALGTLGSLSIAKGLVEGAQKVWESGVCVVLTPSVSDGPSNLDPSQEVEVTADPRARADGRPTGGMVTAVLAGGEGSVSPDELPAVATFTYTAPSERDRWGDVALVSRSRRGVGKADLRLDTRIASYVASGGGEVAFSGKVSSVTSPFSITGTFPGGTTTFTFDARGSRAGRVKVTGGGSGASLSGSGTYTISEKAGGVLLLTAQVRACVDVSKVCRNVTHPITLTPER